ncbi:hypothetical protein ADK55_18585 [Streptomyces sp. WM4235]|uniref:hypothetical protein n=1 Tax=Streptomyces sp. WM4235 TaxID=1415551 RepID=UPI0006AEC117|nr:hypothetical protein [Streptomyces sp. WM4235]KOU50551.1 hypothetical protein ADK55_18585 [Streptomyces sp. WM4235]
MTAKRLVARCTAVTVGLLLVASVTAGAYHDGGWRLVAATWVIVLAVAAAACALTWAIDNWNAR